MTYLDTSVVLAALLGEDRRPPEDLWRTPLVSSRLLQYEAWTRVHSRRLTASHGEALATLLQRIAFVELTPEVLARANEPFPVPLRALDALHLATMSYLREEGGTVLLVAYDQRMVTAARKLGFAVQSM